MTVSSPELGTASTRTTSTDLAGRYEIRELPTARYRVAVTRAGYLPLDYGQRRPGEQGRPIQLTDGQVMERVDFALPRMSVITGRVTDETGEPMEGVTVVASRSLYFEGRRKLVPIATATTDDEGDYRLQRLSPATYVVMASTRETWTVIDAGKETVFGYAPTYFPGLTNGSEARRINVGLGQQVPSIDLSLIPGRAAKITGTAMDSKGVPFGRVNFSDDIRGLNFASFRGAGSATVSGDGAFTISNITPGEYRLSANRQAGDPTGEPEIAEMTIVVDGTDIENVSLRGSVGGTVSGRLIAEGATPPKWSSVRVEVRQPLRNQSSPGLIGTFRNSGSAVAKDDGSFVVEHRIRPGQVPGEPSRGLDGEVDHAWQSRHRGRRALASIPRGTPRRGNCHHRSNDDGRRPAGGCEEPADSRRDGRCVSGGLPEMVREQPRRQGGPSGPTGHWRMRALPPGEYLAIALEYIEDTAWSDPDYLESLRQFATKVTLAEGASQTVSLKLATAR